jgi:hypothetical protein
VEGLVISQRKGNPAACKREEEISQVRNHAGTPQGKETLLYADWGLYPLGMLSLV